jgi:hypothetical protein
VSPHSAVILFPIGGALGARPRTTRRSATATLGSSSTSPAAWESPADDTTNIEWARSAWRTCAALSTGGTYVNFLTEEEGDERIHAAYGKNYARLVDLKTKWDPSNLFRANKNIAHGRSGLRLEKRNIHSGFSRQPSGNAERRRPASR